MNRLFETPDYIAIFKNGKKKYYWYEDTSSYSFNFDEFDNARVGKEGETHYDLYGGREANYSGRIFTKYKIISFWYYPPKEKLEKLIKSLEKELKIKIWNDPNYKIEIIPEVEKIKPGDSNYSDYSNDDWANKKVPTLSSDESEYYQHLYIPLKNYKGSYQRSEEELKIRHLDSKRKHFVPYGYGSKNPKYIDKRKWQMASITGENKTENLYPRIFEFERSGDPAKTLELGKLDKVKEWLSIFARYSGFKINPDWTINVKELIIPAGRHYDFNEIPEYIQFGTCYGNVIIRDQNLISMRGLPKIVKGDFFVDRNKIEDLEGCPLEVEGDFYIKGNKKSFTVDEIKKICEVGGNIIV